MRKIVTLYDFILLMLLILLAFFIFITLSPSRIFNSELSDYDLIATYNTILSRIFFQPLNYFIQINNSEINLKDEGITLPYLFIFLCKNKNEITIIYDSQHKKIKLSEEKINQTIDNFLEEIGTEYSNFIKYIEIDVDCKDGSKHYIYTYGSNSELVMCYGKSFELKELGYNFTVIVCK